MMFPLEFVACCYATSLPLSTVKFHGHPNRYVEQLRETPEGRDPKVNLVKGLNQVKSLKCLHNSLRPL